jgi:hypothetical protein
MKLTKAICITAVLAAITLTPAMAAPVESVESGRTVALAKVQGFLCEKVVADHMKSLGLTQEQVGARLALLSDAQIEQLAAQVDTIRAGGTVESDPTRLGVVDSFFRQLGAFFYNIFNTFCFWRDQRVNTPLSK